MHDFERSSQEERDREYAQKLSDELQATTISPPIANNDLSTYPPVPGPPKPQKPLPSNVFPGTPMAAPPFSPGIVQVSDTSQAYPSYPPLQQQSIYSYPASPTPQHQYSIQPQHHYPAQHHPQPQHYSAQPQHQYPAQPQHYPTQPQHPATAYNVPPPASYQYNNSNTSPNNNMDIHQKANRMAEMGFALHDCMNALTQHNGNEDAALNFLLTKTQHDYHQQQPQQQQQQQNQQQNQQQAGLFGFWKKPN